MIAIGDGAVVGVDEIDQLREIERELAVGFDRADVIRALVIVAREAGVEAVPLDHDHVVRGDEVGDVPPAVIRAGVVIAIERVVDGLVEALAPTVKPVDDWVALPGSGVIGRQEDAEVAGFPEDLAELDAILNSCLGAEERKGAEQEKYAAGDHPIMLTEPQPQGHPARERSATLPLELAVERCSRGAGGNIGSGPDRARPTPENTNGPQNQRDRLGRRESAGS